jgi:hypothetical protein
MTGLPRILYVPNERGKFRQRGMRRALSILQEHGMVEARVYSLLLHVLEGRGETARQEMIGLCREFKPDVVIMQHIYGAGLTDQHFSCLRESSDFRLLYHEGDPFTRWRIPVPFETAVAARWSDVVVTVGADQFCRNFQRKGVPNVGWTPHTYDPRSFGSRPIAKDKRVFDVVMIANRSTARTAIRAHPGSRDRRRLVDLMSRSFGSRFALYGKGWTGPSAMGPVDFWDQERVIQSGVISVNWDHYPTEKLYFSDRLPISLASGSIHATTNHPGYESLFPANSSFLRTAESIQELVDVCHETLASTSEEERGHAYAEGREWVANNLRQDHQFVDFLKLSGIDLPDARAALDSDRDKCNGHDQRED